MQGKLHVRPAEGLLVRDPYTKKPLPSEGAIVNKNAYWMRRLKAGDCELVENKVPEKSFKKKSKAESSNEGEKE